MKATLWYSKRKLLLLNSTAWLLQIKNTLVFRVLFQLEVDKVSLRAGDPRT